MNDPEISDNLRRIVPDDLSPEGLVEGARRKRRRRHGMVGAVAALALVGLAVPLVNNLPRDIVAQPAASPTTQQGDDAWPVSPRPGAQACYGENGLPYGGEEGDIQPAPLGAVRAWLCGDYPTDRGLGFVGPLEPLTSGMDELMRGVQAKPERNLTTVTCSDEYTLAFAVVFEYEDGSRRAIRGERAGCHFTYDGEVFREGADEFLDNAVTAWERQRTEEGGAAATTSTFCPGPQSLLTVQTDAISQAAICAEGPTDTRVATYLDADLQSEVMKSIRATLESRGPDVPPLTTTAPEERQWLALSDKFGSQMTLVRHSDGVYRARMGQGPEWFWAPEKDLSERLDRALAAGTSAKQPPNGYPRDWFATQPPATPDPAESPSAIPRPWVADGCKNPPTGDLLPTDLPDGVLPKNAESVWLCASGEVQLWAPAPPMEPLRDATLIAGATAAFNELPLLPPDQACTMELGPSYLVVHEYADGTRHAVELQEYGCHAVYAGATVKSDSELYKEKLLELWRQQRADLDTTQTRPGPLCPLTGSVFVPTPEDAAFTSGATCVGQAHANDVNATSADEAPLPPEVLAQISGQLPGAPLDAVGVAPDGGSIVLLTKAGDPFVLFHQEDGTFFWQEGESVRIFTPTGAAAVALTALFEK